MTYTKDNISFQPKPTNHPRFIDLTGHKYGKLTVIGILGHRGKSLYWYCMCDCGGTAERIGSKLRSGRSKTCGCSRNEVHPNAVSNLIHGAKGTPTYRTWISMRNRCRNSNDPTFPRYGGRGITVCDRWLHGENGQHPFVCFLEDMGERPSEKYSIERVKNECGYSPDNCKWATMHEQGNNRRTNRMLTYHGKTQSLAMWCRELHLRRDTVNYHLKHRRTVEEAFHIALQ